MSLAPRADQDSRSALHWASSAGHSEIIEFSLQLGEPMNNKQESGCSPHTAASVGLDKIIKVLLGKGEKVNAVNQMLHSLFCAVLTNEREISVKLLAGGAGADTSGEHLYEEQQRIQCIATGREQLKMVLFCARKLPRMPKRQRVTLLCTQLAMRTEWKKQGGW